MILLSVMDDAARMAELNDVELLGIIVFSVYATLLLFRLTGILQKNACPECGGKLTRRKRSFNDKIIVGLTLLLLPFRRYKCVHCGWEGLRWKVEKEQKKAPRP